MDWFKNLFAKYPFAWLAGCLSLVSLNFIGNLVMAMGDGVIDPNEFQNLSTHANGLEMLILLAVMAVLKKKP